MKCEFCVHTAREVFDRHLFTDTCCEKTELEVFLEAGTKPCLLHWNGRNPSLSIQVPSLEEPINLH